MKEEVKMYSKFENLTEEKKKKIIDVCIEEFSRNGYKNASTNNIVKNAEISKGILFHYFGSKKSLYLYVYKYVTDFIAQIFYEKMRDLPSDFFERVMELGLLKLKVASEFPVEYKFILDVFLHTPEELKQEVQESYGKIYGENMELLFKDIDISKFRPGIDSNKAMEVAMFAFDGLSNKYFKQFKSIPMGDIMGELEKSIQDFNEYIEILKNGVYENGNIS
jgi:TetR/AcrR family transcriptional regulator